MNPLAKMQPWRNFSFRAGSIEALVLKDSIFLGANHPAKLPIPHNPDMPYELTVKHKETKEEFEEKVKTNCPGVNNFQLISDHDTVGGTISHPFQMVVNNKKYRVYPDLFSIVK